MFLFYIIVLFAIVHGKEKRNLSLPITSTNMVHGKNRNLSLPVTTSNSSKESEKWVCGGGQATAWSYERGISWCIGGGGGTPFQIKEYAQSVRQIRVWTGGAHNGFRAIHMTYFNGKQYTAGSIPSWGDAGTFTFQIGEYLIDSIILGGNGIGTRCGYLEFHTNMGNSFKVGTLHTAYISQADNGFFTGIYGQEGTDIDHLTLLLMKRVRMSELQNVKYPTLAGHTGGLTPKIYSTSFCNDGNLVQSKTASFEMTVGTSRTWGVEVSFTVGGSLTVSAGVPGIINVEASYHWEVTASGHYSQTTETTDRRLMEFPIQVEPRSEIRATYTWWDSEIDVPYTANMVHTFDDGSNYVFYVEDMYRGAHITESHASTSTRYLEHGEGC